jgi:hypothetical protein
MPTNGINYQLFPAENHSIAKPNHTRHHGKVQIQRGQTPKKRRALIEGGPQP